MDVMGYRPVLRSMPLYSRDTFVETRKRSYLPGVSSGQDPKVFHDVAGSGDGAVPHAHGL